MSSVTDERLRFISEPFWSYRVERGGQVIGWINRGLDGEWWPHRFEDGDWAAPSFPTRREAAQWLEQEASDD